MKPHPWLETLFRPLIIGVMFGCIALSLVELVRLIFPAWNGTYLIVGCVLAAVEANYSYRLIRRRELRGTDRLRFRAVELGLFFLLLRVGRYVGKPWPEVLADLQTWPHDVSNVMDMETTAAFVLALLSWHVATQTLYDLDRLDEPPERHRYYVPPMQSLTHRFFWGGVALLIAAGLTRIGIAQLLNLRHPSVPGLVLNVLLYFLLGLVMLGQVRLATLLKRWQAQGINVADNLPGRWVRYSLAFIGLAAFIAFLLPTGYTMGLLEVVGFLLNGLVVLFSLITGLLFLLVLFPLAWLMSKLFGNPIPSPPGRLSARPILSQSPGGAPVNWFEVLRSLFFWVVAVGIAFYVVRSYLRDHPELIEALTALRPVQMLRRLWMAFWGWLRGWAQAAGERLPSGWLLSRGRRGPTIEPFRFFRLGALSARERVLYYYLSILRRADRRGFPRRPAQTPYEYQISLDPHLPQAHREMESLTQAFVEARYSRHAVESEQARRVRTYWQRVKAALRTMARHPDL